MSSNEETLKSQVNQMVDTYGEEAVYRELNARRADATDWEELRQLIENVVIIMASAKDVEQKDIENIKKWKKRANHFLETHLISGMYSFKMNGES